VHALQFPVHVDATGPHVNDVPEPVQALQLPPHMEGFATQLPDA